MKPISVKSHCRTSRHPVWRWVMGVCMLLLLALAGPWLAASLALRGSGGSKALEVSALPPMKPLNLPAKASERPALPPPTPPELMMQAPYSRAIATRPELAGGEMEFQQPQFTPEQIRLQQVNQVTEQILSGGLDAVASLRDSKDVDDKTYDEAILRALPGLLRRNPQDAITLLDDFVRNGRMDAFRDPELYERAVAIAKNIGVNLGGQDPYNGMNLSMQLPADSPAQAYIMSNIVYTNSRRDNLPSLHLLNRLPRGGATRTRTAAALLYGRMGYHNDNRETTATVKSQLDNDSFNRDTLLEITRTSSLPPHEQRAIMRLIN